MLGAALVGHLSTCRNYSVAATVRPDRALFACAEAYPGLTWHHLDAETCTVPELEVLLSGHDWVINAAGLIKQKIHTGSLTDWEKALRVNALFSVLLAQAAERIGATVLQITTDCVFSGLRGGYTEDDVHDALDVYGKSKSLGEIDSPHIRHLRCSIVGPERDTAYSLLNWFLGHRHGDTVSGFINHHWNGLSSYHFARICQGVMDCGIELPLHQHVVPADTVSKHDLLVMFARHFGRNDITIRRTEASEGVDRTLTTVDPALNDRLWRAAGYDAPPTIDHMIQELAAHAPISD